MKLQPILDHIIVERKASAQTTSFGLVIPDSFAEKPDQGVVIAVGPGKRDSDGNAIPLQVKVGDKIIFDGRTGFEIEVDGQTYLVLKEVNVFTIIKD